MDLEEELSKFRQIRALDDVLTAVKDLTHLQKDAVFATAFKSNTNNEHSLHYSSHTTSDASNTAYSSNVALRGVIACLSRYGTEEKKMLGAMIMSLGGTVEPELSVLHRITHLIIPEEEIHLSTKYRFVREKAHSASANDSSIAAKWVSQIRVVTHEWVFACHRSKQYVEEDRISVPLHSATTACERYDDGIPGTTRSSPTNTNLFTANQQSTTRIGE